MHFQTALDGGGYGSYGVASTYYTGALQTVTYQVPAYRFDGARVFTNKPPCGPSAATARRSRGTRWRSSWTRSPCDLGLDPADMRKAHLQPPDSLTANFLRVGSMGLGACIDKVVAASGWRERRGKLPPGRGLGLACSSYICGAGLPIYWNSMPQSGVQLKLDRGGGVTVFCGSTEIGQGSDSILASIVAEVLGIDPFDIRVVTGDTDLTPVDLGSYSSRVTLMTGNAALQAAERAREMLVAAAARSSTSRPRASPWPRAASSTSRSRKRASRSPRRSWPRSRSSARSARSAPTRRRRPRAATAAPASARRPPTPTRPRSSRSRWIRRRASTRSRRSGSRTTSASASTPCSSSGQVEGSVYMGLGEAMMEEMAYRSDVNGNVVHKFPSLLEYKSPTTKEMPEVVTFLVEDPDPNGPFGAKEVGQGPLLPIPPAVANAIFDAVGVRIDEVPVTPEKVLQALKAKAQGKEPRATARRVFPAIPYPDPIARPDARARRRRQGRRRDGAGGVR